MTRVGRHASGWSCCSAECRPSTTCRASRPPTCCGPSTGSATRCVPIGITRDGQWVLADDAMALLAGDGSRALPDSLEAVGAGVDLMPTLTPTAADEQIVVLPLLHGPLGEDGTVQGLLEVAGVAYVGAGVLGSALCMDKAMAKVVLAAEGDPAGRHIAARDVDVDDEFFVRVVEELGLPVFVKPANLGSSVGISRAVDLDSLRVGRGRRAGLRRVGVDRGGGDGARDRDRRARQRRASCLGARRDRADPRLLRLRRQVPRRCGAHGHPRRPTRRGRRGGRPPRRRRRSVRCAATAWHASTSSTRSTGAASS